MMRRLFVLLLLVAGLSAGLCGVAWGQEITGQIRGIVTDASGAVIANATVTITNVDRHQVVRTLETNSAGEYVAPFLPVGRYSLSIEIKGFRKFVKNDIELNFTDRLAVDAALQPGAVTETVSVEAHRLHGNPPHITPAAPITGTQ